jgi:hypothetical protein
MTGPIDIDAEPIGRIAGLHRLATKANPSKDGDAKLQG